MVSQIQLEANRRNAQLSTGPITPEGKAAVRLNSLRHGLRARATLLPPENSEDFDQLCDDLEAEWRPQTRTEQLLLEQMAVSQWLLMRFALSEAGVFMNQMSVKDQFDLLERYAAQRARLERSFSKAMHDLEHLQQHRPIPDRQPEQPEQTAQPEPLAASPDPHPLIPFPLPSSEPLPDAPYIMAAPAADTR